MTMTLADLSSEDGVMGSRAEPCAAEATQVFGEVEVRRLAYRRRGQPNLYPTDAALKVIRPARSPTCWSAWRSMNFAIADRSVSGGRRGRGATECALDPR